MIKLYVAFVFSIFLSSQFFAQIYLNEGSNANASTILTPEDKRPDWLEIFNSSNTLLNLQNYGLSDDKTQPLKWIFPNSIIDPLGFKVILANGNSAPNVLINHFETAVFATDSWKYLIPNAGTPANWNTNGFNDGSWLNGSLGIGYGDGDDVTTVPDPTTSVYVRRVFNISDTSKIRKMILDIDYDDGFVAYLNGIEITRIGLNGYPPAFDEFAPSTEASIYQNQAISSYTINQIVANSALRNGQNVLAIEVHNSALTSSDLSLIPFLTFGFTDATQYYTGVTHPYFGTSAVSSGLEANFTIKSGGETIYLSNPSGQIIDSLVIPDLEPDMSIGKQLDGTLNNKLFTIPTPNSSNNAAASYTGFEITPIIDTVGGMFATTKLITITNLSTTAGQIRYTLNGQSPTLTSNLYSAAITISANSVLKARCFSTDVNLLPSLIKTQTYLINEDFTLPVISISTDDINLYGATGIFDNYTTDWRRQCDIEYFDANGKKQFGSRASIKPDGGAGGSRSNPQHSVTIEPAHSVLGDGKPVEYPLIPEKGFINEYYAFYLRNGSNFWNRYPQKDATMMRIMRESEANSQAYSPVIAFVNGEYFGVYELREKANERYFEANYGNNPDSLDLLSVSYFYGPSIIREVKGSDTGFYAMRDFINTYPANSTDYFTQVNKKIDLFNFADYISAENWFGNVDWIYNNMKIARTRTTDNKWRFFLQDMELGLGEGWTDYNSNIFDYFRNNNQPNAFWSIYNGLVQNVEFKNYFVNRYADLMNTTFQQGYYTPIVNNMYNQLLPEMPKHFQRWTGDIPAGMNEFAFIQNSLLNQFNQRNNVVRNQIVNEFNLQEPVDVILNVLPVGAGSIKISTIIPEIYPWTGVYFDGVPVTLKVIANPGFVFSNWSSNGLISIGNLNDNMLTMNIPNNATFTANFTGAALNQTLNVSEINYNPDSSVDAGNWIELFNNSDGILDLTNYTLKSKNYLDKFKFADNTIIPAKGYLVIASDTARFHATHPEVINYVGSTEFGWSNKFDTIHLYDRFKERVLQVAYKDGPSFPNCADGFGRTLEWKQNLSQSIDSSTWFCGCIGGSPGKAYSPCAEPISFTEINVNENLSAVHVAGDWIELKNNTNASISLKNYVFKDDKDDHVYTFPNVSINSGEYLVLSGELISFKARHEEVLRIISEFDFKLGNSDALRLFDSSGLLIASMNYDFSKGWPTLPLTADYTFEYKENDPERNPTQAKYWFAGCEGGSPSRAYSSCLDLGNNQHVSVYPNPASDQLNIIFDNKGNPNGNTIIEMYDLTGRIFYKNTWSPIEMLGAVSIDVSQFRKGMYYVKISNASFKETIPVVKF